MTQSIPQDEAIHQDGLLTPKQTAAFMGVSPETLQNWRWQRKGPPFVRLGDEPGAAIRYRRADLVAWLDARSSHPEVSHA